jgi:SAM-dependent methyltransferase
MCRSAFKSKGDPRGHSTFVAQLLCVTSPLELIAISTEKMAQFDDYGALYTELKNRPIPIMQNRYANEALGDLSGLRVLDAACGTGFYSKMCAAKGAREVIGIDISPGMIQNAEKELATHQRDGSIRYLVGDFEQADLLQDLGLGDMNGTFDIVMAGWLLNYASDWQRMAAMFCNISRALKPGGRFIGLTYNPFLLAEAGVKVAGAEAEPGDKWEILDSHEFGIKIRIVANASPLVEYESNVLYVSEYEKASLVAGFPKLTWKIGEWQSHHIARRATPLHCKRSLMIDRD